MAPITLSRLSDLSPQNVITAYCADWRCPKHSKGADLDIAALSARYGDLRIDSLSGRLRCTACGHKPAEIRLSWTLPK